MLAADEIWTRGVRWVSKACILKSKAPAIEPLNQSGTNFAPREQSGAGWPCFAEKQAGNTKAKEEGRVG